MKQGQSFYIVGIGLSAGGLQALQDLLSCLPANPGASFVVVSHLLPDHESKMDYILSRSTAMPVSWIHEGESPQINQVHLLPPGKILTLNQNKLHLRNRLPADKINPAITIFFTSLAYDMNRRAIGVILSGTGTDGVEGVKAIEDHGGIVMVQQPSSARFRALPANVIAEDHPDFISTPEQLALALMSHIRVPPYAHD